MGDNVIIVRCQMTNLTSHSHTVTSTHESKHHGQEVMLASQPFWTQWCWKHLQHSCPRLYPCPSIHCSVIIWLESRRLRFSSLLMFSTAHYGWLVIIPAPYTGVHGSSTSPAAYCYDSSWFLSVFTGKYLYSPLKLATDVSLYIMQLVYHTPHTTNAVMKKIK